VGASIGIALSTNLHESADDLLRDADGAMYQAKAKGKNCYIISDQTNLSKAELQERWKRMVQMNWLAQSDRP
jgi:predicted signal transduction protein with EAL and GGDEF domain